jgi:hypothetical protein
MRSVPVGPDLTDPAAVEHDIYVQGSSGASKSEMRTAVLKTAAAALAVLVLAAVAAWVLVVLDSS